AISNKNHIHGGSDRDFANQSASFRYIGNGSGLPGSTNSFEGQSESALFSLFGNVNYSYRNLYLLSANVRRDGSSRFGPENQYGQTSTSNPGSTISTRGNPKVKWESSTQADAGIDIGIWKDKLNLTVDYFIKTTSDMLIPIPLPLIGGSAKPPYLNAGKVENK